MNKRKILDANKVIKGLLMITTFLSVNLMQVQKCDAAIVRISQQELLEAEEEVEEFIMADIEQDEDTRNAFKTTKDYEQHTRPEQAKQSHITIHKGEKSGHFIGHIMHLDEKGSVIEEHAIRMSPKKTKILTKTPSKIIRPTKPHTTIIHPPKTTKPRVKVPTITTTPSPVTKPKVKAPSASTTTVPTTKSTVKAPSVPTTAPTTKQESKSTPSSSSVPAPTTTEILQKKITNHSDLHKEITIQEHFVISPEVTYIKVQEPNKLPRYMIYNPKAEITKPITKRQYEGTKGTYAKNVTTAPIKTPSIPATAPTITDKKPPAPPKPPKPPKEEKSTIFSRLYERIFGKKPHEKHPSIKSQDKKSKKYTKKSKVYEEKEEEEMEY